MAAIYEETKLPEGYEIIEGEIYKVTRSSKRKIINSTVIVMGRREVTDRKRNKTISYVDVEFHCSNGKKGKWSYETNKIRLNNFLNNSPDFLIIEPGCKSKAEEIIRWIIQNEMQDIPIRSEVIHPFGWDNKKFYCKIGTVMVSKYNEYPIAAEAVELLKAGSDPLNAVFLGSVHGPLCSFFADIGIKHNFATAIKAGSGVGKTDLSWLCVNNVAGKAFALASNKKDLVIMLKEEKDITLVLDDYNKAESVRTKERIQKTVSEIIQMTCDSAPLLAEGCSMNGNSVHVILNQEEVFKNISTINRTFSVKMDEPLPLELYKKMKAFSGEKMLQFIQSLIRFIETNYDELAAKVKTDYEVYLNDARNKYPNRIADTVTVQKVLKKIIIFYYKHIEFDEKYVQLMDSALENSINRVAREMCDWIDSISGKEKDKIKILRKLSSLISDLGNGYKLSDNEKRYQKEKGEIRAKQTIGFCAVDGYLSFDMDSMIELLNSEYENDEISGRQLSQALNTFNLAHKDSEGKMCSKWHTTKRMYHVEVGPLMELCAEEYDCYMMNYHYIMSQFKTEE